MNRNPPSVKDEYRQAKRNRDQKGTEDQQDQQKRGRKDPQSQLDAYQAQLDDQQAQLDEVQDQLDAYQAQLDANQDQLNAYQDQLNACQAQHDAYQAQHDAKQAHLDAYRAQHDAQQAPPPKLITCVINYLGPDNEFENCVKSTRPDQSCTPVGPRMINKIKNAIQILRDDKCFTLIEIGSCGGQSSLVIYKDETNNINSMVLDINGVVERWYLLAPYGI